MLTTLEAEVDVDGNVVLLEPLRLNKKSRAIVTLLEEDRGSAQPETKGNARALLDLLIDPKFKNRKSYSAEEIEDQIRDARESWD